MESPGQIITFYSYKGGTGRSMALANVAYFLANQQSPESRGVLMIDWDLEAPGLHQYFVEGLDGSSRESRWRSRKSGSSDLRPGLIDFFEEARACYKKSAPGDLEKTRCEAIQRFSFYVLETGVPGLSMVKAGRFDENYPKRIQKFDWEGFHDGDPAFFRELRRFLQATFSFVLIDSRTGLTDTSGICVQQMPEKVVLVFVPNRQSIDGILDVVRRIRRFRVGSSDLRPLVSFPLASRIDGANERLRRAWRFGGSVGDGELVGYQGIFEDLFRELYELDECDLSDYFDSTQIHHDSDYAYGEKIAVQRGTTEKLSLGHSFANFARRLTTLSGPWESLPEEAEIRESKRREEIAIQREKTALGKARSYHWVSLVCSIAGLLIGLFSWLFVARTEGKSKSQSILAAAAASADPLEKALLLANLEGSPVPAGGVALAREIASMSVPLAVLSGHAGPVTDVAFSRDGSQIATASADSTSRLWNSDGRGEPLTLLKSSSPIVSVAWSHSGKEILAASREGEVVVFDNRGAKEDVLFARSPAWDESNPLLSAAFDSDDRVQTVRTHLLDKRAPRFEPPYFEPYEFVAGIRVAVFGGLGKSVWLSTTNSLWFSPANIRGGFDFTQLSQPARVDSMVPFPDDKLLATSLENVVNIWKVNTAESNYNWIRMDFLVRLTLLKSSVDAVAFSSDGRFFAVGGSDGVVRVYRFMPATLPYINYGAPIVLRGHKGPVRAISFSPDGNRLASASEDTTVRVWSLRQSPEKRDLDWPSLLEYFRHETNACLSVDQRVKLLSETFQDASQKYSECERVSGRTVTLR
jgi:WD40 repeat protein